MKKIVLTAKTIEEARKTTQTYLQDKRSEQMAQFWKNSRSQILTDAQVSNRQGSEANLKSMQAAAGISKEGISIQLPGIQFSIQLPGIQFLGPQADGMASYVYYLLYAENFRRMGAELLKKSASAPGGTEERKRLEERGAAGLRGAVLLYDVVQRGIANGLLGDELAWIAQEVSNNIDKGALTYRVEKKNGWNGQSAEHYQSYYPHYVFNGRGRAYQHLNLFALGADDYHAALAIEESSGRAYNGLGDCVVGNPAPDNANLQKIVTGNRELAEPQLLYAYYKYTVAGQINLKKAYANVPQAKDIIVVGSDGNLAIRPGTNVGEYPALQTAAIIGQKLESLTELLN